MREQLGPVIKDRLGYYVTIVNGNTIVPNSPVWAVLYSSGSKLTYDQIHPHHPYDGGPFSSLSVNIRFLDGETQWGNPCYTDSFGQTFIGYKGRCRVNAPVVNSLPVATTSADTALGPTVWHRYKPVKPTVGVAQFVYELREMGPATVMRRLRDLKYIYRTVKRQRSGRIPYLTARETIVKVKNDFFDSAKDSSNLYLAWEFGWKLFIKDLRDWFASIKEVDTNIARLKRNNGRWGRKGGTFSEREDSIEAEGAHSVYPLPSYYTSMSLKKTSVIFDKIWFQGLFRYYISGLDDPRWGKTTAISKIYGLDIGPDQLWQVMPWSWLFGWFSDVGKTISNIQSSVHDGLVAKYAYLMHERSVTEDHQAFFNAYTVGKNNVRTYHPFTSVASITKTTKSRVVASPFGFNMSLPDFTPWQVSILSALGISRLKYK